jgi:hypothetical protein
MAGTTRLTGLATGRLADGGTAAHFPFGTGTRAGLPTGTAGRPLWLATASPAAPTPASSSPMTSATAAAGRRTTRAGEMCRPRRAGASSFSGAGVVPAGSRVTVHQQSRQGA